MRNIKVLDCTLRDGGYCNQWRFGRENIPAIIEGLADSKIDIVECGFVTNKVSFDADVTKFPSLSDITPLIPDKGNTEYVAMINFGEYDVDTLPECADTALDGLRLAFHKKNIDAALDQCRVIKEKGYKVFVQAMVTMRYSDSEFFDLIAKVNDLMPYAFYIVDSFGNMRNGDLIRYYALAEHNLSKDILLGFHSHNNLQLAYSNAKMLVEQLSDRGLIIDSSVYGMGRGAGNLNTELFTEYLNSGRLGSYSMKPIFEIMDGVIDGFYRKAPWGYSFANYLSAVHNAHPNYAGYLGEKGTLTYDAIDEIFEMMEPDRKVEYSKAYAEEVYIRYMELGKSSETHLAEIRDDLKGRDVVLVAPGKSSETGKDLVAACKAEGRIMVSVNHAYSFADPDYIFVSNRRRYKEIPAGLKGRCIITSNIPVDDSFARVSYKDLLNDCESVRDNAGMMAIKFLISMGVRSVRLAGFDGYSYDETENYASDRPAMIAMKASIDDRNSGMDTLLKEFGKETDLKFLTEPVFVGKDL